VSRVNDDLLQDYLDGRLSQGRRKEFEALLERDAELTGRVEACRELGRTLRDDGPELSPGFYTRARARFEDSHSVKRPSLSRLFSWEAAGLAAAAALAGILFIPGLLQWNRGEPFTEVKPAVEEKLHAADDLSDQPTGERWEEDGLDAEPPAKEEAPSVQPSFVAGAQEAKPEPAAPPRPAAARRKKGAAETPAGQQADRIPLPRGAVAPGGLIVIETEEQWLGITELSTLPYDPRFRWALIGARPEGLDCAGLNVETTPGSHRILLQPGAEWGCAIALPRDGRPIEIISTTNDSHE
jgi:hypothetical protein